MNNKAVELLSRYIRLNTSNPPGNEYLAAGYLSQLLAEGGVSCREYEYRPGRASVRAVIKGSGNLEPLILLHHMDVIDAQRDEWSFDPFGGEVIDGYVCGRGALDTKSLGIMQLITFLEIKKQDLQLKRDLVFLATADEESGAECGVQFLLRDHPADFPSGIVLNEGSYVTEGVIPGRLLATISPGEKGPCWMKLTRRGQPGHGSTPHGNNALEKLTQAVNRLTSYQPELKVTPVAAEYFRRMAEAWEFLAPFAADGRDETLLKLVVDNGLMGLPQIKAMLCNSLSLNSLHSGSKVNVIPSLAEAEVDTRLLPGQDIDEWVATLKGVMDDNAIQVDFIMKGVGSASSMDTGCYRTLEQALLDHFPGAITAPYLMLGTTDSRFFRDKGMLAYGFCPAVVPLEHLKSIHGIDEKIKVDSLLKGTEVYIDVVKRLCL
jgi:acetylornithine deacetylase/succinyl-diaminopimelate desuccinylase-like protein